MLKSPALALAAFLLATPAALAAGSHAGGHGHGTEHSFGKPGKASEATRTVTVELNDQMQVVHEPLTIKQGETIRFVITNAGETVHELSVGDSPSQRAHALMMKKMPDMKHEDDATAVTLEPGETKEIIWKFSKPVQGFIELACHIPGHFEAGMVSKVKMVK